MFSGCSVFTNDLSRWDVSKVTRMDVRLRALRLDRRARARARARAHTLRRPKRSRPSTPPRATAHHITAPPPTRRARAG
eukprot:6057706-Prymnesium_polylepis.1